MWCHVKSTTCTNVNLPHTTETTGTNTTETTGTTGTAMTGQCRQPQAPLAKRPGTSSLRRVVRQVASAPSLTARATSGTTSTRRHTRRIMESSSEPDSDDALPKRTYQELLEAFRQRHCISINLTDGTMTKLDNGFTELIDYAITQRYPTLEYLLTTGRTTFVEDMIRKYEHVIQRTIQNIETHDFWKIHCNNMLILDRERRKRRGKGQANAQVSFAAAKRAPIGYYYRCKYSTPPRPFIKIYLFSNFLPAMR
jgi:hypothetical protein